MKTTLLKEIINIDNKAKEIVEIAENKIDYLDEEIEKILIIEKEKIYLTIQDKLINKKNEYDNKLKEYRERKTEYMNLKIQELEEKFINNKDEIINTIYNQILNNT